MDKNTANRLLKVLQGALSSNDLGALDGDVKAVLNQEKTTSESIVDQSAWPPMGSGSQKVGKAHPWSIKVAKRFHKERGWFGVNGTTLSALVFEAERCKLTYGEIGKLFGLTDQYVGQLARRHGTIRAYNPTIHRGKKMRVVVRRAV